MRCAPIMDIHELAKLRPKLGKLVLLGGVFDLLHRGHIAHLEEAKKHGDTLVVHVTSDGRVREKKGPSRPILPEMARATLISAIRFVDYVFITGKPHYDISHLEILKPSILFFNQEAFSPRVEAYVAENMPGQEIFVSPRAKEDSTSEIISRLSH